MPGNPRPPWTWFPPALALALALAQSGCLRAPPSDLRPPSQVIVDTDAGADDLLALAFLLARRDVAIEAVTIAPGLAHARQGAANVRALLHHAGRADISVHVGRTEPLAGGHTFPAEWRADADALAETLALPAR